MIATALAMSPTVQNELETETTNPLSRGVSCWPLQLHLGKEKLEKENRLRLIAERKPFIRT